VWSGADSFTESRQRDWVTRGGVDGVASIREIGVARMAPIEFASVDHINMFVRDLDESVDFYSLVFGTDPDPKEEGTTKGLRWCIIGIPSKFYFCLYELKGRVFDPDAMHINHIGFFVPDFDETVKRIRSAGIPVEYFDRPITWTNHAGQSRSLYIRDPNGYYIEFTEKLGGGLG